jgi:hypothetical protein
VKHSESVAALSAALVAARAEMKNPLLNQTAKIETKSGGSYSYRYADLAAACDAVSAALGRHKLACLQPVHSGPRGPVVVTRVIHESGEWMESEPLELPAAGGPKEYGSAVTYARRYSLVSFFGLAAEADDDGTAAETAHHRQAAPAARAAASAPPRPANKTEALVGYDKQLAREGLCRPGELMAHVRQAVEHHGHDGANPAGWNAAAWTVARDATKAFESGCQPATEDEKDRIDQLAEERDVKADELFGHFRWPRGVPITRRMAAAAIEWLESLPVTADQ